MKKSVLAVAVAALVASGATSAATVYDKDGTTLSIGGRVEALFFSTHDSGTHGDSVIRDRARLNIGGRTKIIDGFTGYGFAEWEWNHKGDDSENTNTGMRYAYVGLDMGQFGDIRIGRWEQAMDYVTNVTDHFEEHGCNSLLGDNRSSGQIGYEWKGYGVTAGIRLQTAIDNYNSDVVSSAGILDGRANADFGIGVYAGYRSPDVLFGPIDFRIGYQYTKYQQKKDDGLYASKRAQALLDGLNLGIGRVHVKDEKIIAAGLSWGTYTKGPYIAFSYNYGKAKGNATDVTLDEDLEIASYSDVYELDTDVKIHGFEAMLSYGFDCGVVLNAGYHYKKVKLEMDKLTIFGDGSTDLDAKSSAKMKYVQFNAIYNINPNFRVWAEAHIDCDSDDGIGYITNSDGKAENAYLVGVRYTF